MTSFTASNSVRRPASISVGLVGRMDRWLHAMPHPPLGRRNRGRARGRGALGQSQRAISKALPWNRCRWARSCLRRSKRTLRSPMRCARRCGAFSTAYPRRGAPLALLVPDLVVRVFILPFDTLPRSADDALAAPALAIEEKRALRRGRNGRFLDAAESAARETWKSSRP